MASSTPTGGPTAAAEMTNETQQIPDLSVNLSAKCTWLRKPLVMICLIAASFENIYTVIWLVKSEVEDFIFCWAMASIAMNLFVVPVIQRLRNRTVVLVWLWLQGALTMFGMTIGMPVIPLGIFMVKSITLLSIYLLYETFEFKVLRSTAVAGGMTSTTSNDQESQQDTIQPPLRPQRTASSQLSEAELRTISATIMAHELILQRRYDDWLRATVGSGLPSYDEIVKVIEEEQKQAEQEKPGSASASASASNPTGKSPPPTYVEALLLPGQVPIGGQLEN